MNIGEGLGRSERETIIRRCDDEQAWDIYTSSPVMARKLARLAESHGVKGEPMQGGIRYRFPLNAVSLRKQKNVTAEQRERSARHLAEVRPRKSA